MKGRNMLGIFGIAQFFGDAFLQSTKTDAIKHRLGYGGVQMHDDIGR